MTRNDKEIILVNQGFYNAFESQDIDMMDKVWHHDEKVKCIHPGWDLISGWEKIRESWANIFLNSEAIKFSLTDIHVSSSSNMGWVTCIENFTSLSSGNPVFAQIQATNIFEKIEGKWLMVNHHASPILSSTGMDQSDTVH